MRNAGYALAREPDFDDPELVGRLVDSELTGERLWTEDELRAAAAGLAVRLSGACKDDTLLHSGTILDSSGDSESG